MSVIEPSRYGPIFASLIEGAAEMPLGPGEPVASRRPALEALTAQAAFAHADLRDAEMADACVCGVWLLHNYLDESHRISQNLPSATGSFWHGIMHRREPDYGNSKYWFRQVGRHPVFPELQRAAAERAGDGPGDGPGDDAARRLASGSAWDPFAFVDLVERSARGAAPAAPFCRAVQAAEWRLLFDHCYRQAVA